MTRKLKILFICTFLIIFVNAFGLNPSGSSNTAAGGQDTRQVTTGDKAKPQMSDAEKLASWKGERVTILDKIPLWCKPYADQTGVIIESKPASAGAEIGVQLDNTGGVIVRTDDMGLGFHSELESARAWVGRSLWAKGTQTIAPSSNGYVCLGVSTRSGARVEIKNLEKVTITRVEFGTRLQRIYFLARTDDGREGWLDVWSGYDHVDGRFHLTEHRSVGVGSYSDRFYLEDPRKLHPDWGDNIWRLIESGEVTVGMSEEMARMACGWQMKSTGSVLAGGEPFTVTTRPSMIVPRTTPSLQSFSKAASGAPVQYECSTKKFMVEEGRVTKQVEKSVIKAALAFLIVDEVQLVDAWPPGCQPPFCTQATAGEHFLSVYLKEKENNKAGNLNKETAKVYVLTSEGTKAKRWDFGFEVDQEGQTRPILLFKVRTTGGDFTLFWSDGQAYKLTARPTKEEKR